MVLMIMRSDLDQSVIQIELKKISCCILNLCGLALEIDYHTRQTLPQM